MVVFRLEPASPLVGRQIEGFDDDETPLSYRTVAITRGGETIIPRQGEIFTEGDVIYVEKLNAEADATVTFDQVLAVVDGENSKFGAPVVAGASVEAKVLKNGKAKKVVVFKYRPKKDSKSIRGHRQPYTKVQIEKISV